MAFIADISRHIWDTKYRYRQGNKILDHSIEDTWRRVARALASAEAKSGQAEWEQKFYSILEDFKFLPGGRILAGCGTQRQVTLFNCFVMGLIEDSMDGIFNALKEGALTMQQGGGVGYDFSTLRPTGTPAHRVGSIASGPVSFMHIWDSMCATLLSTGARRGAMMATLRCDHPDIEAFIEAKKNPRELRHFNLSVLISDDFMQAVTNDDEWPLLFPIGHTADKYTRDRRIVMCRWSGSESEVPCQVVTTLPARELWEKIMRATYEYAEPGVLFIDRINRMNNLAYHEQISSTNPCVTDDTWIHTSEGPRQVKELLGQQFTVIVNGKRYCTSFNGFFCTGHKKIYRLSTKEGYTLNLTEDHPILQVTKKTRWNLETTWTRLSDLVIGDELVIHNHRESVSWPGLYGEDEGYVIGLLIGDGTFRDGDAELRVWPMDIAANDYKADSGTLAVMKKVEDIVSRFHRRRDFIGWRGRPGHYRFLKLAQITRIAESLGVRHGNKTITPAIECCSSNFYRGFLRGLFDADGSVQGSHYKGISIRLSQSDSELLQAVQRMLLRLGIASTLYQNRRNSGPRRLPDGRGGDRLYQCRADHELVISKDNLHIFSKIVGFIDVEKQRRLSTHLKNYKRALNRERFYVTISAIEFIGKKDVFDVQIQDINAFDANGLYVHNCGEIPLPPYGACDLGSINLTQFVEEAFTKNARLDMAAIEDVVRVAVRLMDNVVDVSGYPLARQRHQAQGARRIGLGITGLADSLIMMGIRYGEDRAYKVAGEIMQAICHQAYRASVHLAKEKGAFPFFERDRYLDSPFIKLLPAEIQSGIKQSGIRNSHLTAIAPTGTISLLANNVSSGLEPVFDFHYQRRILQPDGNYAEYELRNYAYHQWQTKYGNKPLPDYFTKAHAVTPDNHLKMQAAIQPFIDNAISKTINIPENFAFSDFRSLYFRAYELGLKGCTTFRPNPVTGSILKSEDNAPPSAHCCSIEREAD